MSTEAVERPAGAITPLAEGVFPVASLLPDSVAGDRRIARAKRLAIAAVVVAVLAVIGVWMLLAAQASDAQEQLAQAQTTGARLKATQAKYAEIPQVAAQVAAGQESLATAMQGEVVWSTLLTQLKATAPPAITIEKVSGALPADSTEPAAAGQMASYGTMNISGRGPSFPSVSAWLTSLTKIPGISMATLNRSVRGTTTDDTSEVTFEATLTLSEKALAPAAATGGAS